jgi:hypothetical protein
MPAGSTSLVLLTQIQYFTSPCACHEHLLMSSCAWRRRVPAASDWDSLGATSRHASLMSEHS